MKSFTTCDTIRPTFGPFGFLPFAGRGIDMPQITVDGKRIECKDRQMILQACLDSGMPIPHYCYHPGLSIPASCRICLVEVEGLPKLVPSCQTPVRDGMTVQRQLGAREVAV